MRGRAATARPSRREAAFARRARALLLGGAALGVVAGAAGIVLQGATAGGTSFWAALDPSTVREVLGTRFGTVWGLRVARLRADRGAGGRVAAARRCRRPAAALGAVASPPAAPRAVRLDGRALAALALPAAFLAVTPALGGHATTQHPVALLAPLDVIHVVAMSAWVGGLIALVVAVPAATRALDPAERTALLSSTLSRFSAVALTSVAALIASGTAQSIVHLRSFGDLLHTAFGRAVLIKIIILLALVGLGALNRQRSLPRLRAAAAAGATPGAVGRVLRTTLRAEVALVVVVLGVTAALVSYPPPSALSAGPFSENVRTGPLEVELTVDPARTGANAVHVYLFRAADGAPFAATKELTLEARLPSKSIGPLTATVHRAGPRPLRRRRADAGPGRHMARDGHRPRLGLRRVHRELLGAGAMLPALAAPLALLVGTCCALPTASRALTHRVHAHRAAAVHGDPRHGRMTPRIHPAPLPVNSATRTS